MPDEKITKKQLNKLISEADNILSDGLQWLKEWADYKKQLTASEIGTTPPTPPPNHPPGR